MGSHFDLRNTVVKFDSVRREFFYYDEYAQIKRLFLSTLKEKNKKYKEIKTPFVTDNPKDEIEEKLLSQQASRKKIYI